MTNFFLDSSALAKRYLTETGSMWVTTLTDPSLSNTIILAELTQVEVAAALAARHRAPRGISRRARDTALRLLLNHCQGQYQLVPTTPLILGQAVGLTQNYRLRGYDAVQLATALSAHQSLVGAGLAGLTFVAADADLVAAALAEGLAADNPNNYP